MTSTASAHSDEEDINVPEVLRRLRVYWWCAMDDDANEIPLREISQLNALGEAPIHIAARAGGPDDLEWLYAG